MPTNKHRTLITLTLEELASLKREATKNAKSLNNYLRVKIGLPGTETRWNGRKQRQQTRTTEKPRSDITSVRRLPSKTTINNWIDILSWSRKIEFSAWIEWIVDPAVP